MGSVFKVCRRCLPQTLSMSLILWLIRRICVKVCSLCLIFQCSTSKTLTLSHVSDHIKQLDIYSPSLHLSTPQLDLDWICNIIICTQSQNKSHLTVFNFIRDLISNCCPLFLGPYLFFCNSLPHHSGLLPLTSLKILTISTAGVNICFYMPLMT